MVSPRHRLADREVVPITELGSETFIAHNVVSPYREVVLRELPPTTRCPCTWRYRCPTIETIRKLVMNNEEVAFLPRMCVEQEIEQKLLCEVRVKEIHVEREEFRLVYRCGAS